MKILYFISVHSHGRGGHAHSLNHISQEIGKDHDVKIISFGTGTSEIIKANPHFLCHVKFNGLNILKLKKTIKKEVQIFKPDIYHCFDSNCYNIIRTFISSSKNAIVLNKCGGPNPKNPPCVENLILFSHENLIWYQNQKKFKRTKIHLISNRVKPLALDQDFKPIKKKHGCFIFMRICRIGHAYKKSIEDSINLISSLLSKNCNNVKLYVVGVVENSLVLDAFNNHKLVNSGHVKFLTEEKLTNDASKMLYLANAVIGTGRGLMEAASLGIPILAINSNSNIPVLMTNETFFDAFQTNFSERNVFTQLDNHNNLENILKVINDPKTYNDASRFSKEVFNNYFNVELAADDYLKVYLSSKRGRGCMFFDAAIILRSFISFIDSLIKSKTH